MPHAHARGFPSPCVLLSNLITPVGQDRLKLWHICQAILTRSGSGDPELQRWARCAPPKGDKFMKHPHYIIPCSLQFVNYRMRIALFSGRRDIPVSMPQDVSSTKISSSQPSLRCGFWDTFHIRIRECRRWDIVAVIRDTAVRYGVNDNVDELPRRGRCEFV